MTPTSIETPNMRPRRGLPLVLLMACGSSHAGAPDADDAPPPPNVMIDRPTPGDPLLLAFRQDDGPWAALPPDATGFTVTGARYALVAVCKYTTEGSSDVVYSTSLAGKTLGEGTSITLPCTSEMYPNPSVGVTVTGQMTEIGTVFAGFDRNSGTTSPWTYTFQRQPGVFDLFAMTDTAMTVRRDVTIVADTTLDPISVAGGRPLGSLTFNLVGLLPDDVPRASTVLHSKGQITADLPFVTGTTARFVPTELLRPDDDQICRVFIDNSSNTAAYRRAHVHPVAGATTTFTLPSVPTGITMTSFGFAATTPVEADLVIYGNNALNFEVSRGWLAGALQVEVDPSAIPGFDLTWITSTASPSVTLVTYVSGIGDPQVSVTVAPNATAAPVFPRHMLSALERQLAR